MAVQGYVGDVGFENYTVVRKKSLNMFDAIANSNKFYTLELHEDSGAFRVFTQYGRVGAKGRLEVRHAGSRSLADNIFDDLLDQKLRKGYKEVELVQATTGSDKAKELVDVTQARAVKPSSPKKRTSKKSNLDPLVQAFVIQIFEEANAKIAQLVRGSVNTDGTSPLGALSVFQIDKGRRVLQQIATLLANKGSLSVNDVIWLSNEYYSLIPRSFGRSISPSEIAIRTQDKISEEMDVLKFYEDSLRMGVQFEDDDVDVKYKSLNSDLELLSPKDSAWKDIEHYVRSSESRHHNVHLSVKNIFTVKQKQAPKFNAKYGNVRQLFHGSRSANLPGILSSHLKLPNQLSGVQITGAMFGSGLYYADQSSKSSQYSCARFGGTGNRHKTAFMFLCDVALGRVKEEVAPIYYHSAPRGYDSVKGCMGRHLLHNEYIVYREEQQAIRYVIEFEPYSRR